MPLINRRDFLKLTGKVGKYFTLFTLVGCSKMKVIFRKIKNRLKSPVKIPPDSERTITVLPSRGETVSVEMALNSRCSSDYDEDPTTFHWGMFDTYKRLSCEHVDRIEGLTNILRFTNQRIEVQTKDNVLTFIIDNTISGIQKDWVMVESGIQQQAVALICAALGVGMAFRNLGTEGAKISQADYAAIKIKLDAMKSSYEGSYWSRSEPTKESTWLKGNLPDPIRDGKIPLLSALNGLRIQNTNAKKNSIHSISQLLWAARGRTPHFYKSKPWGMTIPTWAGEQHISSIYLISNSKLSQYVNWRKNRPTHSLDELGEVSTNIQMKFEKLFPSWNCFIVLGTNETFKRAWWEIGYQLLNILLQAYSLDLAYQTILLDATQKAPFQDTKINNPVTAIALRMQDTL